MSSSSRPESFSHEAEASEGSTLLTPKPGHYVKDLYQGTFFGVLRGGEVRGRTLSAKSETGGTEETVIISDVPPADIGPVESPHLSPEHSPLLAHLSPALLDHSSRTSSMTIPEMPDLSLPPSGVATGESEHKGPGERSTSDFPRGSAPASAPSSFALKPWQAGFSSWSRIPLLLEMYCHLRRVTQALIKQESLRQAVVATVWLTMCKIFAEESRTPRSNLTAAQKRILLAKEVEKKVAVLIKARGAEIHQDWKIRLQERIAGNFNLLFLNNLLRFTTLVTRPSSGQSSHSKKTMPPAVIALTYTFLSRRRSDSSRRHTLSLAPTSSYAHYRCPSIEASKTRSVKQNLSTALEVIPESRSRLTCYNLLTSLPNIDPNHQARTAANLFQAVHALNKEKAHTPRVLIFNIPVNQHTESLTYKRPWWSPYKAIPEALVMADLAFIFKISQWREGSLNPKWLPRIQEIKDAYQAFLATYSPAKAAYFSEYKYRGERVTDKLSFIKKALLDECSAVEDTYFSNPRDLLEKALIKLYCTKYDGRLDQLQKDQRIYGLPVQALFMALDNHNLVGCKSANERFFLTEGLTQTLQAFVEETLPEDDQRKMREKCKAFLREDEDCPPSVFIEFLMSTHNKLNAYGSAIGPSLLDTGTPKCDVDAHDWVEIKALMNTNVFAPGTYTNIAQMGVAQLQAHGDALPHRLEHELTHTDPRELYNEKMRVAAHAFYTGPGRDHPAGKPSERERRLELPLSSAFSHA